MDVVDGLQPSQKEGGKSLIMLTIWEVWRERNQRVFDKRYKNIRQIMGSIFEEARAWANAGNRGLQEIITGQGNNQESVSSQSHTVVTNLDVN
jgi:hypothetical protein